jgi:hypothetical protein
VGEEIVDQAEAARARALRAQHAVAVQAMGPMRDVPLGLDAARAAIGGDLRQARFGKLLQEERDRRQQRVDGTRRRQPPVRAADDVGLPRHWASGRSMM